MREDLSTFSTGFTLPCTTDGADKEKEKKSNKHKSKHESAHKLQRTEKYGENARMQKKRRAFVFSNPYQ